jgi:pimeloyl-ACP methyl ester carboxylesterase
VIEHKTVLVDGLATSYLEAGQGDPVVLLHGGEFGASAELGWERNIAALAGHYRVLAPDMLGFGSTAKVVDFSDGRGMRIRHIARFCEVVGVESAHFVGNSMGAVNMFVDVTSESPVLPVRSLVTICGGGEIQRNEYSAALYDYDATLPGMRRIVEALFYGPSYPANDAYVQRRYESSIAPGAWEALAAARFRRPGLEPPPLPSSTRAYDRITVPALVVEGGGDKLLPAGWAAQIARQIPQSRSAVVEKAGHCPQIEQSSIVNELLLEFLVADAEIDVLQTSTRTFPAKRPFGREGVAT